MLSPSVLDLARACADTYALPPTFVTPGGVTVRVTENQDGSVTIAHRGSVTVEDWVRDMVFQPVVCVGHDQLGWCHAGFLEAAQEAFEPAREAAAGRPTYWVGHSLGGAEALDGAALAAIDGRPPAGVLTLGAPRVGGSDIVNALTPYQMWQFRRGNDIVPEVPRDVPPLFNFLDCRLLIQIGQAQADFLACHHVAGYVEDVGEWLTSQQR